MDDCRAREHHSMTAARQWWHAPAKASPRRLASRLSASLGLTGASSVTVERIYLDTFDWRLFRRGDALVEEQPDGGQRVLVLQSRAGERAELRVPCTGRPRQPTRTARGPATPVGSEAGPAHAARRRARAGRSVAAQAARRGRQDRRLRRRRARARAPCASACGRCAATRRRPTGSIALLNSQADLVSGLDPMVAAVRANGREPGELPEPPPLRAEGRGGCSHRARPTVFEHLLVTMELNEEGVREQLDPELLHDFRVADPPHTIDRAAGPPLSADRDDPALGAGVEVARRRHRSASRPRRAPARAAARASDDHRGRRRRHARARGACAGPTGDGASEAASTRSTAIATRR